ncbi:methylated-DNA--[protein]-cysteine S-methyltransferase [Lacrimispora aerotolerans]|uniref:methylated-DNA--[protein]-cysteine S-methyltransferase n=1 Tax=Lacrimispora aerotolerans TaxID=36832 RepID=UPI000AF3B6D9|nr:methylated-DNA--[protein]-cysteine S-methyltransferase [Lacrimispora aerotolerans]
MIYWDTMESRVGTLTIVCDEKAITGLEFLIQEPIGGVRKRTPLMEQAVLQIEEYMDGKRRSFDLPLKPEGTEFQKKVWNALLDIPYGETRSYKDIAVSIDNPKACRAVGMANNRNPIAIIIPCHRVIGANGSLVGYGGGLPIKIELLNLETGK